MKLSDIKGEAAIDTLANLIEPVTEILADPDIKEAVEKKKPKLLIAKDLLKKHKKEVIEVLAAFNQKTYEEYVGKASLASILVETIDLLNDEDLMAFFNSQVESMGQSASGLRMVNTEGKKN